MPISLSVPLLQHCITNLSLMIQWSLFLIGSLLVFIPIIYTLIINKNKSNFSKLTNVCQSMFGFGTVFRKEQNQQQQNQESSLPPRSSGSMFSSAADIKLSDPHNITDTELCWKVEDKNQSATTVSGLVNTGNSCFLNSVLQSLSSLPRLQAYLDQINNLPGARYNKLPVTKSLLKIVKSLSVPSNPHTAFKPIDIVSAMASNRRVINREQQDAQELFQLISAELDNESQIAQNRQGFRDLLSSFSTSKKTKLIDNPFTGLLANRLSCTRCDYTEAIRHFSFNNVQLTLPNTQSASLDDCLKQLTAVEYLNGVKCRKCTLMDTVNKLNTEIKPQSLSQQQERLQIKQEIEHRLSINRIQEEETDEDKKLKHYLSDITTDSTKQAMFAKLPKVLCLHVSRSAYSETGELYKNPCHIQFPEILDLAPYCTNGTMNTQLPKLPISTPPETNSNNNNAKYRLLSSIVHYGSHNYGHFIAYKKRLVAETCECQRCRHTAATTTTTKLVPHEHDWFRISDERVDACNVNEVLESNPYMLLYELIQDEESSPTEQVIEPLLGYHSNTNSIPTSLSTVSFGSSAGEEEDDDDESLWSNLKLPTAPPSSPVLRPFQMSSSSSCMKTSTATVLQQRRSTRSSVASSKKSNEELWTKRPAVATY